MDAKAKLPPPEAKLEAKRFPGGWVYEIEDDFGPDDDVPPMAIRGACKVDDGGEIVGDFLPNPNFVSVTDLIAWTDLVGRTLH